MLLVRAVVWLCDVDEITCGHILWSDDSDRLQPVRNITNTNNALRLPEYTAQNYILQHTNTCCDEVSGNESIYLDVGMWISDQILPKVKTQQMSLIFGDKLQFNRIVPLIYLTTNYWWCVAALSGGETAGRTKNKRFFAIQSGWVSENHIAMLTLFLSCK